MKLKSISKEYVLVALAIITLSAPAFADGSRDMKKLGVQAGLLTDPFPSLWFL